MKKNQKSIIFRIVLVSIIVLSVVCLLFYALKGKTTSTGSFPAAIRTESLTCTAQKIPYEKLSTGSDAKSKTRIIAVFGDPGQLVKLSLDYTLEYDDEDSAKADEPRLYAIFAKNLANDGLAFSELNNKLTIHKNKVTLSLFAEQNDITMFSAPYFLLEENKPIPSVLNEFKNKYEGIGFVCSSSGAQG